MDRQDWFYLMNDELLFDPAFFEGGPQRGEFVYHFTRPTTAKEHILGGNRRLLIRPAGKMNDPLEHSARNRLLGGSRVQVTDQEVINCGRAIDKAARDDIRILSTTLDRPPVVHSHPKGPINTRPGKRGFSHPAMWAHYAEGHSGICLIFNRNELNKSILQAAEHQTVKSGEVIYEERLQHAMVKCRVYIDDSFKGRSPDAWALRALSENWEKIFLRKHEEWSYEEEFRWGIIGEQQGDFFVELSGNELAGFVVGSECRPSEHEELSRIADKIGIPTRVMMWTDGSSNIPWPLSSKSDPPHIAEYWQCREIEINQRVAN